MGDCSETLRDCYDDEAFEKFKAHSYQILAEALHKVEADFSLSECNDLATPVPLIDPANAASASFASFALVVAFALISFM